LQKAFLLREDFRFGITAFKEICETQFGIFIDVSTDFSSIGGTEDFTPGTQDPDALNVFGAADVLENGLQLFRLPLAHDFGKTSLDGICDQAGFSAAHEPDNALLGLSAEVVQKKSGQKADDSDM